MIKILDLLNRHKIDILGATLAGLAGLFLLSTALSVRGQDMDWREHVIRLHILAADDTQNEQMLKLALRDGVWGYISGLLEDAGNMSEAADIIAENLAQIELEAARIARANGSNHAIFARFVQDLPFPHMVYGGTLFLPQGNYQALQIIIGEGNGGNWWCIVFPPMCLMDITRGQNSAPETAQNPRPRLKIANLWRR
ncbi:MAG: stage II sporulation protein R [Clostridiales bacterium]|jgi:stage II sporulation protein R|nr:stage II sporulation protein R [Clostridiales bacterium]